MATQLGMGAATPRFSNRFLLLSAVPAYMGVMFLSGLVLAGAPRAAPSPGRMLAQTRQLVLSDVVLLVVAGLTLALVIHPLHFSMLRILEGYWGRWGPIEVLRGSALRRHRRRHQELERIARKGPPQKAAVAERILGSYPRLPSRILPTTLGNALRAAEDRAGHRYGLDLVTVMPRLYPLMNETAAAQVRTARVQLDLAVTFCFIWLILAGASAVMLAVHGPWLFLCLILYLLSWLSYRSAVAAARSYGVMLGMAVDLHRFDLMKALHLPLPPNLERERQQNAELMAVVNNWESVRLPGDMVGVSLSYEHESSISETAFERAMGLVKDLLADTEGRKERE